MPFSDIYISTFKNDMEYNQLLIQTAVALQTNKYIQVRAISKLPLFIWTSYLTLHVKDNVQDLWMLLYLWVYIDLKKERQSFP